uniref:Uncharacterized protein n=1 Tax=Monodon monoceros TaxID=40151 RepID=A0A8C6AYH6_MONMO
MSPGWDEKACVQASECVTAGVRDGDLGANGSGRAFQEARSSAARAAARRAGAPWPARSARRDSALTHRTRCRWISRSARSATSRRRLLPRPFLRNLYNQEHSVLKLILKF